MDVVKPMETFAGVSGENQLMNGDGMEKTTANDGEEASKADRCLILDVFRSIA